MRTTSSREVYRNDWIRVREDAFELDDGSTGIYGVVEKADFALVVPEQDGGFWLVEQYASSGRLDDARALMDRLCALVNDVGMVSEEYDVGSGRHAGNTPQALSHLALVRAADALVRAGHRSR